MKTLKNNIKSVLEIHHLELVRLRIGYLNECHYSIDLHYNELKNFGETDFRLSLISVWNQVPNFSKKECSLFTLTDYIICPSDKLSLKEVHNILTPHFSNEQINALTQAIKQIDLWTRSMKHLNSKSTP
jgi:alkylhydroperoxidase family enzyme